MTKTSVLALALLIPGTVPALAQQDAVIVFYRAEPVEATAGGGAREETAAESGTGVGKVVRGLRKLLSPNEAADLDQSPTIYAISNGGNRKLATIARGEFFE